MFVCYTLKLTAIKTVQSKESFILRLYRFYSFQMYPSPLCKLNTV